ncbi:hypothetical protein OROMI_027473 [Orobanche minor]
MHPQTGPIPNVTLSIYHLWPNSFCPRHITTRFPKLPLSLSPLSLFPFLLGFSSPLSSPAYILFSPDIPEAILSMPAAGGPIPNDCRAFRDASELIDQTTDCSLFPPEYDFTEACSCNECSTKIMDFEKEIKSKINLVRELVFRIQRNIVFLFLAQLSG